jgi:hypothetical protein
VSDDEARGDPANSDDGERPAELTNSDEQAGSPGSLDAVGDEGPVPDPGRVDVGLQPIDEPRPLDLTRDDDAALDPSKARVATTTIEERREDTRKLIAVALLFGLAAVSVAWLAVGVWGDSADIANAGSALDKIFTGILGLTGTAVGFYFGIGGGTGSSGGGAS